MPTKRVANSGKNELKLAESDALNMIDMYLRRKDELGLQTGDINKNMKTKITEFWKEMNLTPINTIAYYGIEDPDGKSLVGPKDDSASIFETDKRLRASRARLLAENNTKRDLLLQEKAKKPTVDPEIEEIKKHEFAPADIQINDYLIKNGI